MKNMSPDTNYAQRYSILGSIMLGSIMGPIDASIVNIILPTITHFFGAPISTAQWVPMIYLLTMSSLLLFYGRLGDIMGYKRIYLPCCCIKCCVRNHKAFANSGVDLNSMSFAGLH